MKVETKSSVGSPVNLICVKVIPLTSNSHLAAHSVAASRFMRVDIQSGSPEVL